MGSNIDYHLRELEIARDPTSAFHVMPEFADDDTCILDIGCGIGQTFAGFPLGHAKLLVGLDVDLESLTFAGRQFRHIYFTNAIAERLPFRDCTFDVVISRVALPYTDIPQSLSEIARVLKDNGRVWLTLHAYATVITHLKRAVRRLWIKDVVYRSYVVANGVCLHFFGRQFRFPINGRCESFQTRFGMQRCLKSAGFTHIRIRNDGHFVCTARIGRA